MNEHFLHLSYAVRPFICMMQGPSNLSEQDVDDNAAHNVEGSWDSLKEAPLEVDPFDDWRCGVCEDVVQDDLGVGFQIPRGLPEPQAPSLEIQRRHNLTHWPYAPWCPHCVMARRPDSFSWTRQGWSLSALVGLGLLLHSHERRAGVSHFTRGEVVSKQTHFWVRGRCQGES